MMGATKTTEEMEYAVTLIELSSTGKPSVMEIVHTALTVLNFGGIASDEFLAYLNKDPR
jgi:hypothetical protein